MKTSNTLVAVMASYRNGETEDTFIDDLSMGLETSQIKTGASYKSGCLANLLPRIEEEAVTIIHEYFISYDIPKLIHSLEELTTCRSRLQSLVRLSFNM